jgi:hypothetical protein
MSIKSFKEFIDTELNEDAKSILDTIIDSAQYKALKEFAEAVIDKEASDSDDYMSLVRNVIPKVGQKLKSDFNF